MTPTIGFIGGIWLLWTEKEVHVEVVNKSKQEIHAIIKVFPNLLDWLLSGIYANPKLANRKFPWNNLRTIVNLNNIS